uniref:anti-sigma factor n=1 Tax=Nocardia brasiliensis TaxID=37326 RepID=UPI002456E4EB
APAPPPRRDAPRRGALHTPAGPPAKRGCGRRRWVAAAAAVVVAVGAGAVVYRNSTQPPSGITAQVVLAQPDVLIRSAPVAGGGRLVVYTSAGIGAATASFEDVPAPAPGRSYQMWLVATDGATRSVGVMTELPSGPAVVTRFAAVDVLAVTDEPAAGSPKPTGDAIAKIGLA